MSRFHEHTSYFLSQEINDLYLMHSIKTFAISMITIFIPIFLLKNNYSLYEVGVYLILRNILALITCYFSLKFASTKGIKTSIYLSIPITIVFFLLLYSLNPLVAMLGSYLYLLLIIIVSSFAGAFYWMGFHVEFAKFSNKKTGTKQLGLIQIFSTVASALGPLLGALIISFTSFNGIFLLVIVLLAISIVPLIYSKEVHESFNFEFKKIIKFEDKSQRLAFLGEGVKDMSSRVFWPILLYFIFVKLSDIGGLYAISNTILVLFTLYLSKKLTSKNNVKILKFGTYIHSLTLFARTLLKTLSLITLVQGVGALSWTMINLPFKSVFYRNSKIEGIPYVVYFREFYLNLGRAISVFLLLLLLMIFNKNTSLIISIMFGAIFVLFMSKIRDNKFQTIKI